MSIYAEDQVGSGVTFFLFETDNAQINVTKGVEEISKEAVDLCLSMAGDSPFHADRGLAPPLFTPRSEVTSDWWQFQLSEMLWRYMNYCCSSIFARVVNKDDAYYTQYGELITQIVFTPKQYGSSNLLTFPFHIYTGASWEGSMRDFRKNIYLNGQPFEAF
jgi:hypothetical protein